MVPQPSSLVSGYGGAEEETFSRLLCDKAAQALQEIREPRASAPRLSLRRTISELGALARQSSLRQSPLATPFSSSDQDAQDAQRGPGQDVLVESSDEDLEHHETGGSSRLLQDIWFGRDDGTSSPSRYLI